MQKSSSLPVIKEMLIKATSAFFIYETGKI